MSLCRRKQAHDPQFSRMTGSLNSRETLSINFCIQRKLCFLQENTAIAELTVTETFDFAARTQGTGLKAGERPLLLCMQETSFLSETADPSGLAFILRLF